MNRILILSLFGLVSAGLLAPDSAAAWQNSEGRSRSARSRTKPTYPDFVLPSIEDQKPIRLSDYRGKKVMLVHFASW